MWPRRISIMSHYLQAIISICLKNNCKLIKETIPWAQILISQRSPTRWQPTRLVRHTNVPSPSLPAPSDCGYSLGPTRETVGKASRSHMWHTTVRRNVRFCAVTTVLLPIGVMHMRLVYLFLSMSHFMYLILFRGLPRIDRRHSQRWKIIRFRESPGNSKGMWDQMNNEEN